MSEENTQEPTQEVQETVETQPVTEDVAPEVSTDAVTASEPQQEEVTGPLEIPEVDKFLVGLTPNQYHPLLIIKEYIEDMRPGKAITEEFAARKNLLLYRTIMSLINNFEDCFKPLMNALLKLFVIHEEGVFSELYLFRSMAHMNMSKESLKAYPLLMMALKKLALPASRKVLLKQVDMMKVTATDFTEESRQRFINYFNGN